MKALVAIKRVIDHNVRIHVKPDETGVIQDNVKMSMNPFDETAVEEAIRMKESGTVSEVVAISIGPQKAEDVLRTALAMGADRAILIKTDSPIDAGGIEPLTVAKTLKEIISQESPDLVFLGKQAIDDDSFETGQMLAGLLSWGHAIAVSDIKIDGEKQQLHVACEIDGGLEQRSLKVPCIITTDLRLNEPRYASLPNVMKARSKPLSVITTKELGIDCTPRLQLISVTEPPPRQEENTNFITLDHIVEKIKTVRDAQ